MAPVLGEAAVKEGTDLMLASLQHRRINRRVLLLILEHVLATLFPEMAATPPDAAVPLPPHLARPTVVRPRTCSATCALFANMPDAYAYLSVCM
jgi:hypothetical protein